MSNLEDFKPGTLVELSDSLKYSREENWIYDWTDVVGKKVKHGKIISVHESLIKAIEVEYRKYGSRDSCFIHYKDLTIIDKQPTLTTKSLFNIDNLDI